MKMYEVEGTYQGRKVTEIVVDSKEKDGKKGVEVDLWLPKPNFDEIPKGEDHYDHVKLFFENEQDYLNLLFRKREGNTARKYIRQLGFRIVRKII